MNEPCNLRGRCIYNCARAAGAPSHPKVFYKNLMKRNLLILSLAFAAVTALLYAGLNGITKDHGYGFFFTFIGAMTTIGLGLDVVNQLKIHIRKSNLRKLGRY